MGGILASIIPARFPLESGNRKPYTLSHIGMYMILPQNLNRSSPTPGSIPPPMAALPETGLIIRRYRTPLHPRYLRRFLNITQSCSGTATISIHRRWHSFYFHFPFLITTPLVTFGFLSCQRACSEQGSLLHGSVQPWLATAAGWKGFRYWCQPCPRCCSVKTRLHWYWATYPHCWDS